ncbi:hypothetical protein ACFL6I_22520 [candidate division KSB1 bacterium]
MKKRQIYLVIFLLILLGVFSSSVYAQGTIDTILTPFENLNIGDAYKNHWYIIDAVLYFVILVGMAQYVFSQQFQGPGGKAITIGFGVAMALSASFFEWKYQFKLLEAFGPLAVIAVVVLFLVGVYKFAQALGAGGRGVAMLSAALLFFYISATMEIVPDWIAGRFPTFWALLNLLAIVFLIWGFIDLISGLAGLGGGGGDGGRGGGLLDRILGGNRDRGRDRGRGRGPGEGGEGPGWDETRKPQDEFDYDNPAIIVVYVTDVDDEPIKGATVAITGPDSGFPRHWPRWTKRGPYYTGKTGPDGRTKQLKVPSGNLRFDVRHPGYRFSDIIREGRRYTTTYWIVEPNEDTEIHLRLRRLERDPEPEIIDIQPTPRGVYFHGRIRND